MITALVTAFVVFALAAIACDALKRDLERERLRRVRLERWIRGNLLLIRCECAPVSPQAISVINSIECALPTLAPVDGAALASHLMRLQREQNARLLDTDAKLRTLQKEFIASVEQLKRGAS